MITNRYPASHLSNVVYGIQPMTTDLAQTIRTLRRDHHVDYTQLGFYLCQTNPDSGTAFGLGRALTGLASLHLHDDDTTWT